MRARELLLTLTLVLAGCTTPAVSSITDDGPTVGTAPEYPATVTDDGGEVTIATEPASIVSLSSTATEMLFAIGAGDQVIAVDEFSVYPEEAPVTQLSGFTPNLEAILGYEPDLVVISFDPGELEDGLAAVGVPTLLFRTAPDLDASYTQIEALGVATGHREEAAEVIDTMRDEIESIVAAAPSGEGISFFHEVDETLYSPSSASFLGQVYALFGLENIADAADDPAGFGFPQLSSEYVVVSDPELIFLGDADFGVTAQDLTNRPGWSGIAAVRNETIIEVDTYLASNWGPRVVELVGLIADALNQIDAG